MPYVFVRRCDQYLYQMLDATRSHHGHWVRTHIMEPLRLKRLHERCLNRIQRHLPRIPVQVLRALMWHMRFVTFGAEQDGNTNRPQHLDISSEGRVCGLSCVQKGQGHDRDAQAMPSVISPRARVSDTPSAHLLRVLKLAPPTIMASAIGSTSAAPGFLCWWRTGNPVCSSREALSTNPSARAW